MINFLHPLVARQITDVVAFARHLISIYLRLVTQPHDEAARIICAAAICQYFMKVLCILCTIEAERQYCMIVPGLLWLLFVAGDKPVFIKGNDRGLLLLFSGHSSHALSRKKSVSPLQKLGSC